MKGKMMRKAIVLLLALSLLLAACGSKNREETDSRAETSGSPAQTEAAGTETAAPSDVTEAAPSDVTTAPLESGTQEMSEAESQTEAPRFFETKDLSGQTVFLSEICASHKLTMVNFWASWCPPCVRELPDLEALYQKYKDAGVAVVGVLLDGAESTGLKDGKELLQKAGVSYLNVLPTRELESLTSLMYVPTTIFLNEKGEMVGDAVVGADLDAYEERIKAMLP